MTIYLDARIAMPKLLDRLAIVYTPRILQPCVFMLVDDYYTLLEILPSSCKNHSNGKFP